MPLVLKVQMNRAGFHRREHSSQSRCGRVSLGAREVSGNRQDHQRHRSFLTADRSIQGHLTGSEEVGIE